MSCICRSRDEFLYIYLFCDISGAESRAGENIASVQDLPLMIISVNTKYPVVRKKIQLASPSLNHANEKKTPALYIPAASYFSSFSTEERAS